MEKGNQKDDKRIFYAATAFIEAELALKLPLEQKDFKAGDTTRFFRYYSIRDTLVRRLKSEKNATFLLVTNKDFTITIKKGKENEKTVKVTIKEDKLCLENI